MRTLGSAAVLVLIASTALAAARARYGGELRVVVRGETGPSDPALADGPAEATVGGLTAPALCRLDRQLRPVPVLAEGFTRLGPLRVRIGMGAARSTAPTPAAVAERWERLSRAATLSPYRALLFPLRGGGRSLDAVAVPGALDLSLSFPWPDLERALCHPALGIPGSFGPFTPTRERGHLAANPTFALGRPFVDRLRLSTVGDREAARLLALDQSDVMLSPVEDAAPVPAPALYATYLAFRPSRVGPQLREDVERAIERPDLTRLFVHGPAVPMVALLPPALMPQPALAPPPPAGDRRGQDREVTLLYDETVADHRAVAERLQVRLHDRGYQVKLQALARADLRRRWARGDFELMLHSVLLPPLSTLALGVVLDVAGRHDLLAAELPPLGALADAGERDALARQRAEHLRDQLPLIPLYAQALGVRAAPRVQALATDGFGLPILDGAFLSP